MLIRPAHIRLLTACSALIIIGCGTKTETITVIQDCAPGAPNGKCETGKSCVDGACIASAGLCSASNLAGTCAANTTCFLGGCVVTSSLCSAASPAGPCSVGSQCVAGSCVATATLCTTSNTSGTCPRGLSCVNGLCGRPADGGVLVEVDGGTVVVDACTLRVYTTQPVIGVDTRGKLTVDGLSFKDSNGSGTLDPYEDWRLTEICRARDLVSKMTAPQKIGLMGETSNIGGGTTDGTLTQAVQNVITQSNVRQALIRFSSITGVQLAGFINNVQKLCEAQPLGVPFVVTADPAHAISQTTGATGGQSLGAPSVTSPWPGTLGLGAIGDQAVTRAYGDAVRREFMAMGFRWQLGPQADLATEPRWGRVSGTFGENAFAVSLHVRACIEGFQGTGQGGLKNGIAATMKHFPGAGPNEDGKDSHVAFGRYNVFPGNNFEYHQIPFRAAIDSGAAAVMPCYSIFKNQYRWSPEQTGPVFSKGLITSYLKRELGFTGMVTSDWGTMSGRPWGVESLTPQQRVAQFLRAGSHQLGSDSFTIVQGAYDNGLIGDADINPAAEKILEMTFKLGLFENPFVDVAASASVVRSAELRTQGFVAQKKAIVILNNREHTTLANTGTKYLPIDGTRTLTDGTIVDDTDHDGTVEVYYDGIVDELAGSDIYDDALTPYDYTSAAGTSADGGVRLAVVKAASAATADIAVLRITSRKGARLDYGSPLSFDGQNPSATVDTTMAPAIQDRNKVINLLRIRDGYTNAAGEAVAAANPTLKIILVMNMDRPGIVKPFINGLTSLSELAGQPGTYPSVSTASNIRADGLGGVDGFLVDFGAFDRALLDVLFNKNAPTVPAGYVYGSSRLPMEIPSSDAEVEAQYEDVPADTFAPTYALGAGSTY